jgi:dUTP pyrophosphatase
MRAGAIVPRRANPWDAGLDLAALEPAEIGAGARAAIGTGLAVAIPRGHAGLVVPRSGLARHHGITVANAPGLIDAGYRGELTVLLVNLGDEAYTVSAGERIAQLVVVPVGGHEPVEVAELPLSDGRGGGGFGSSGRA